MDRKYPPRFFAEGKSPYNRKSLNHNCHLGNFSVVKECIGDDAWNAVEDTQIGFFLKLHGSDYVWGANTVRYLLSNQLIVKKEHEIWFLVGGQPVRFSLHEFGEVTGLNTDPLPSERCENKHDDFWKDLGLQDHINEGPKWDELKLVFGICRSWSFEKRKMLGLLCTLHRGVYGLHHNVRLPLESARRIFRDEDINSYPWGRVAFESLIVSIKTAHLQGQSRSITLTGFVHALLFWSYESVKMFGEQFGIVKDPTALPYLKWRGSRPRATIHRLVDQEIAKHGEVRARNMREMPEAEIYPEWDGDVEDEELDNLIQDILHGKFVKGYWDKDTGKKNFVVKRMDDGAGNPQKKKKKVREIQEEEVAKKKKLDADGVRDDSMVIASDGREIESCQSIGNNATIAVLVKLVEKVHSRFGELETNIVAAVRKELEAYGDERYGRRIDLLEEKHNQRLDIVEDRLSKWEGEMKLMKDLLTGEGLNNEDKHSKVGGGGDNLQLSSRLLEGAEKGGAHEGGTGKTNLDECTSPAKVGATLPLNIGLGKSNPDKCTSPAKVESPLPVNFGLGQSNPEEVGETGEKGNNKLEVVFETPKKQGTNIVTSTARFLPKGKNQKRREEGVDVGGKRICIARDLKPISPTKFEIVTPKLLDTSVEDLPPEEEEEEEEGNAEKHAENKGDEDEELVDITQKVREEDKKLLEGGSPDEYENSEDREHWVASGKKIDAIYDAFMAFGKGGSEKKKMISPSKPPYPYFNYTGGSYMARDRKPSPHIYDPWKPAGEDQIQMVKDYLEKHKHVPLGKGSEAVEFYRELVTPRKEWPYSEYGWLRDTHMAAYLSVLRKRSMKKEQSPFHSHRIDFIDTFFVAHWMNEFPQFNEKPVNFKLDGYKDLFDGKEPKDQPTLKKWYFDVDHLFIAHNVKGNHWVAVDVDLKKGKIDVYDSILSGIDSGDNEAYRIYMRMIPYILAEFVPIKDRKKSVAQFPVTRRRGIPQNKNPGDCGVYTLKFIECLALGVIFNDKLLNDSKIPELRWRMAAEIMEESPKVFSQFS